MPKYILAPPSHEDSSFLSYWYDNTTHHAILDSLLNQDFINERMREQQKNFQAGFKNLQEILTGISKKDGAQAQDAILGLTDIVRYDQKPLEKMLNLGLDSNEISLSGENAIDIAKIQSATQKLKKVEKNRRKFNTKMKEFLQDVEEMLDGLSPGGKYDQTIQSILEDIFTLFAEKAGYGPIDLASAAAEQKTRIAKEMLLSIITRNHNKIFQIVAKKHKNVGLVETNAAVTKIIASKWASANFPRDFPEYVTQQGVTPKHGNGKEDDTIYSANELADLLAEKIEGCAIVMKGLAGELAVAYGYLSSIIESQVAEKLDKVTVEAVPIGGKSFGFQKSLIPEKAEFLMAVEEAKPIVQAVESQTAKADVGIFVSNGTVIASIGFSVKTGKKISDPTKEGVAIINLQSGTPLYELLTRQAHLNDLEQKAVIELAATHGYDKDGATSDSELNKKWDSLKKNLARLSFIDMLTGSSVIGKAYFMIAGTTLVSMDTLITNMIQKNGLTTYIQRDTTNSQYNLQRSTFESLNKWLPDDNAAPNEKQSDTRGTQSLQAVKERMSQTIIKSQLRIADLKDFRTWL